MKTRHKNLSQMSLELTDQWWNRELEEALKVPALARLIYEKWVELREIESKGFDLTKVPDPTKEELIAIYKSISHQVKST
jgi:hypothetical protein